MSLIWNNYHETLSMINSLKLQQTYFSVSPNKISTLAVNVEGCYGNKHVHVDIMHCSVQVT